MRSPGDRKPFTIFKRHFSLIVRIEKESGECHIASRLVGWASVTLASCSHVKLSPIAPMLCVSCQLYVWRPPCIKVHKYLTAHTLSTTGRLLSLTQSIKPQYYCKPLVKCIYGQKSQTIIGDEAFEQEKGLFAYHRIDRNWFAPFVVCLKVPWALVECVLC